MAVIQTSPILGDDDARTPDQTSMDDDRTTLTNAQSFPIASPGDDFLLVIHSGKGAILGSRHLLGSGPVRIGRMSDNEIALDDEAVSRRHARIERRGDAWVVMDVGSRNGTFVNNREISGVVALRNGDRVHIGQTILKLLEGSGTESEFFEEIYLLTITDHLTKLRNRRSFDEGAEREFWRARRHGRPLGLLMFDIDHFRRVNNDYGHLTGDAVLHDVAQVAQARIRREDTIARYGGEEFVVLLPETTLDNVRTVGEQLRADIAAQFILSRGVRVSVTVSVGCAELRYSDVTVSDLVARADKRLYEAKSAGRNCVR